MSVEYTSLLKSSAESAIKAGGGVGQSKIPQPHFPYFGAEGAPRTVTLLDVTVRTDTKRKYSLFGDPLYPVFNPKGDLYEKAIQDEKKQITQAFFKNCKEYS